MHRRVLAAVFSAMLLSLPSAAGAASQESPVNEQGSSPNFRSLITSISPSAPGLELQILQFSDRLRLTNKTGRVVTIFGYQNEPYARVLPDGTVEQNSRSPAVYLNTTFFATATVPPSADPKAPPSWAVVDRTGSFEWHDHRIHWMSPVLPPQVKRNPGKRMKVFDWNVPISIGSQPGTVRGQLLWSPEHSTTPVAAIVALVAIVLAAIVFVYFVRRRRRGGPGAAERTDTAHEPAREAW